MAKTQRVIEQSEAHFLKKVEKVREKEKVKEMNEQKYQEMMAKKRKD